jgi:hypothetical protein
VRRMISFWLLFLASVGIGGCNRIAQVTATNWYDKFGWKAEDYFDDPQVIALCKAIQADDLKEIDRLIAQGANVNAIGKDNMTPLLWAFPDEKIDRFKKLLEHGADPNVLVKSDLGTRSVIMPGTAVTHLVCKTSFPGYFEEVFAHGGNPNLIMSAYNDAPLFLLLTSGTASQQRIQTLIDKGADLNYRNGTGTTPAAQAVSWGGQYEVALMLLKAGADPHEYQADDMQKVTHIIAKRAANEKLAGITPANSAAREELIAWLEQHGEPMKTAEDDLKRWATWNTTTNEFDTRSKQEIAERKEREAKANAAAKPANPKN